MMHKALVTGAAGAIGSQLSHLLYASNLECLRLVDDLSGGHEWLVPTVRKMPVDLCKVEPGEHVFHLAAHFANARSVDFPVSDLGTNGFGTLQLLLSAHREGAARVVYTGAACSVSREDTPYQIHKALGESYCRYFSRLGLNTVIVRLHNVYGPGEVPGPYRNVIANWVWEALRGRPLPIRGDGTAVRDFVFVDDAVEALLRAKGLGPHTVATGVKTRIDRLAEMVLSACKSKSKIVRVKEEPWDRPGYAASAVRSWREMTALEEGLAKTVAWQRENAEQIERSQR